MSSKKYFINIDLIRVLACIAILLYHLNILKGGYLAVCTFFCLSGFLSCISAFKKEKFSLKDYYINRIKKLYIPLITIVLITIAVVTLLPSINWLNLKPETTSVLLGYNNFWQLEANLDYFARHVNSPFMHLWYIGILLQFDLIFPLLFIPLKKLGDKFHKYIPIITTFLLSTGFTIYFYIASLSDNIMNTYYNTFTRVFSILFGITLGFITSYGKSLIPNKLKSKNISRIIFIIYLIILTVLCIFIESTSPYFSIAMILTTLITLKLIEYGITITTNWHKIPEKITKFLSSICYEVYLVQYPLIFIFQNVNINETLKIVLIIILTFILAFIINRCVNVKKDEKFKILKYIFRFIILVITLYGGYQFIIAKDHTEEMKALEEQLLENQSIIEQKQKEYAEKMKQEQDDWMNTLKDLENSEKELKQIVTNVRITGIGDSVMLGAVDKLYQTFPNGYFDASVSRTAWVVNDIVSSLKYQGILGDIVVFNLGANGDCSEECKLEIINNCEGRTIFWLNVTNDYEVGFNSTINAFAAKHDNVHVIDWNSISKGHYEYFIADGIHLTAAGKEAYSKAIYDEIYKMYLDEFNKKKDEIINNYEEIQKTKISFYGNDLLLNSFDYIKDDYIDAEFNINSEYTFDTLKQSINDAIKNKTLNHKVIFAFDSNINLTKENYQELIDLCKDHEIYIIMTTNTSYKELENENIKVINFYQELSSNDDYYLADKIHLSEKGNKALKDKINETLKKEVTK